MSGIVKTVAKVVANYTEAQAALQGGCIAALVPTNNDAYPGFQVVVSVRYFQYLMGLPDKRFLGIGFRQTLPPGFVDVFGASNEEAVCLLTEHAPEEIVRQLSRDTYQISLEEQVAAGAPA
jgi:hypothetical protein